MPSEKALRARFATIGIGPAGDFNPETMSTETLQAVRDGMADAWTALNTLKTDQLDTGQVTSGQLFGTRDALQNNYLYRMAGAVLGIYGNSSAEASYPVLAVDSTGAPLTGPTTTR